MPSLEKDRFSLPNAALLLCWLFALVVLIGTNYEVIAVFVDTLFNEVDTINSEVIKAGVASY